MNANANGKQSCPACGEKKQNGHLVCRNCFNQYQTEAAEGIVRGRVVTIKEWTSPRARARLHQLRNELQEKQEEYERLQEATKTEAYSAIKETLGGKTVPHQVFCNALKQKAKEVWTEKGGNRLHYELRTMESAVAVLEGTVNGLNEGPEETHDDPDEESSTS